MVGFGCLIILFFAILLFISYKKDITTLPAWHYILAIALVPCAYIASESGWLVAEFGRQPWTIQDMLPVGASVSAVGANSVALTFFIFLALFTTMLAVEINIMLKQIKKGPEYNS
jgi:cytochrome d ubiquinol oxidase subunit I